LGVATLAVQLPELVNTEIGEAQFKVGFTLSVTVTLYEQMEELPAASVAVYVTTEVPKLNTCVPKFPVPDAKTVAPCSTVHVKEAKVQLSATTGFGVAIVAVHADEPVNVLIADGQVITGFTLSVTVTV
jgi:hypothetical protein